MPNKAAGRYSKQALVFVLYTTDLMSKSNIGFHKQALQILLFFSFERGMVEISQIELYPNSSPNKRSSQPLQWMP